MTTEGYHINHLYILFFMAIFIVIPGLHADSCYEIVRNGIDAPIYARSYTKEMFSNIYYHVLEKFDGAVMRVESNQIKSIKQVTLTDTIRQKITVEINQKNSNDPGLKRAGGQLSILSVAKSDDTKKPAPKSNNQTPCSGSPADNSRNNATARKLLLEATSFRTKAQAAMFKCLSSDPKVRDNDSSPPNHFSINYYLARAIELEIEADELLQGGRKLDRIKDLNTREVYRSLFRQKVNLSVPVEAWKLKQACYKKLNVIVPGLESNRHIQDLLKKIEVVDRDIDNLLPAHSRQNQGHYR